MNTLNRLSRFVAAASLVWTIHVARGDEPNPAVETWSDGRMPVTQGLVVWLDAAKLSDSRKSSQLALTKDGDPLEIWMDGSGNRRHVVQKKTEARPTYRPTGEFHAVRFDGQGMHLRLSTAGLSFRDTTVFVVAAPYSNPEPFSAWLSLSQTGKNDFETGLNIDQAVGSPPRLEIVNVEGAGSVGMKNLLQEPIPYGNVARLCVTSKPGKDGITLWVNGKRHGVRDRAEQSVVHMDEIVMGARHYTLGGKPEVRGCCHGDIAEVIIFDRVLSDADRTAVENYLDAKYGAVPPLSVPGRLGQGTPLVRVKDPPPVQVFAPGFTVHELPVDLTNLNNVKYREDGTLVALGYDGRVWLLRDTDGDGVEDKPTLFSDNTSGLRSPIGMDLTPPGYQHGNGVFVVGKTRCVLIVDTDGDEKADQEVNIAAGWKESFHQVDGLGVAFDPRDGSVYYGRGTYNFSDPFLRDKNGKPHYSLHDEAGSIIRVSPDFKTREIVATGIRFPVAIRRNRLGDLFCTDQEGATWVANGNPLDELLHIQKGRHYGFPPRHPKDLPDVIDEPSTFDYGPQHQSTCGFCFNEPVKTDGPVFGPNSWAGDAIVTGESRGKLYRTQLVKTGVGYVARTHLLASLTMLTVDCCIAPDGSLVVACHSGGPDWGSGPSGKGKLYKIRYSDPDHPQPVFAWPSGSREVRVEFDRPVDPQLLLDVINQTEITAGAYVRAGDRFEAIWPGYAVVQAQQVAPRLGVRVYSAQLTPDRRTLVLATDLLRSAVHYAVTLPGMGRPTEGKTSTGTVPQHPQIDLDFDLSGCEAAWKSADAKTTWTGWLPSLNLDVSRRWTEGSAHHDLLWEAMNERGELTLTTQLDLIDMLRPAVQPGSKLDYELPPEQVTVAFESSASVRTQVSDGVPTHEQHSGDGTKGNIVFQPKRGELASIQFRLTKSAGTAPLTFSISYATNEDKRPRPLQLHRAFLPWADRKSSVREPMLTIRPKELEGGSWARGWKVFHSERVGCAKCHAVHGKGGSIGPDLSNLIHRDYTSVMRDITQPSFAINPDYLGSTLELSDGRVLTGVVRTQDGKLHVGDKDGKTTVIDKADVVESQPSRVSVMPDAVLKTLGPDATRDLMTYLLTSAPAMPRDYTGGPRPKARTLAEINVVLDGAPPPPRETRPLRIVLVAGPKDHGPGEHDYPAWLAAWGELMAIGDKLEVATAMGWPEKDEFQKADVIVFYQRGDWDARRAADIDSFLQRGGGLVYIHWAVDGQKDAPGFAKRLGLAWGNGAKFRHGQLDLEFANDSDHPIIRNFSKLRMVDESYWNLTGNLPSNRTLGWGLEEMKPQPLFWSLEPGNGRVFVSIPGHYSWSFDDPLFRVLLLRGIAWTAKEPVDRFNDLVWPGADVAK